MVNEFYIYQFGMFISKENDTHYFKIFGRCSFMYLLENTLFSLIRNTKKVYPHCFIYFVIFYYGI